MIRLGRQQRGILRRCLTSPQGRALVLGYRQRDAAEALARRGLLAPVPGLPDAYEVTRNVSTQVHLWGALRQHRGNEL